ncbi:MAG: protein kinase [Deltaproteobacteria bacterium]|nr:protein kinase [Deltaproteobacteria bacterium]MCB9787053.1 protein kinase [Deltaproteobacteria bacterium]
MGGADSRVDASVARWRGHELFRGMDDGALRALMAAMTPVTFEAGETLIVQGDPGAAAGGRDDAMYLIEEGRVRVRIVDPDGATRLERPLDAPAVVGEMALVTHEPRTATVEAATQVRALRAGRAPVMALLRRAPQAAAFLTRAVGRRLMEAGGIRQVGKYSVVGPIGSGSLCTVFEGVHPTLTQRVALKMLSHDLALDPGFKEAFEREARLLASLRHDHIVRVIDTERAYGTHFIVMERMSGTDLQDVIERGTRLEPEMVARLLAEAAEALAYCHSRDLLHRDVKPGNIFLTDDGKAKLLDFNIAVTLESTARGDGRVSGTPAFMAPEQCRGEVLDGRADLYALGITAYALVTGQAPFEADTNLDLMKHQVATPMPDPRKAVPGLPPYLAEFIARSTQKRREDRFASCAAAAAFLRTAVELPIVNKLALTTVAISYHPSRAGFVTAALRRLYTELRDEPGVAVIYGHQGGTVASRDDE